MKKRTAIGLVFITLAFLFPLSVGQKTIYIDILPDFLGFLIICLGMDKMSYYNRYLKDAKNFSTVCMIISFMTFIGQISPLFINIFKHGSVGGGMVATGVLISIFSEISSNFEYILDAIYMIFTAYFCYGAATELNKRWFTAEDRKERSWKGAYGDIMYSKKEYDRYERLSKIFCVTYSVIAAVYIFNQIYAFVNSHINDVFEGLTLSFYSFNFGIWIFFIPINILFMFYINQAVSMISSARIEPDSGL